MSLHSCSVFTHVHIAYWSHMKCLWFRNKWILLCVISGTIGWLPPQCVAAQRQCCSPGRSQLLPPLTCSTSCSTDARKKINPSLKNPVTKKCLVFNRRKCRNRGEQIHIVSSHQQSADRQRRFHFTASFRIIIRTRPSTLFPHHFSCFHMGES